MAVPWPVRRADPAGAALRRRTTDPEDNPMLRSCFAQHGSLSLLAATLSVAALAQQPSHRSPDLPVRFAFRKRGARDR
jgi:hypothetical protein